MVATAAPRFSQTGIAPQPNAAPSVPPLSFRKASIRKSSKLAAFNLSAALGDQYTKEIDSKGYMARLQLLYSGTETTTTADPTASADWPYNIATLIEIRDSAGGMLFRMKGYNAHLAERYFTAFNKGTLVGSTDTTILSTAISAVQANTINFLYDIWIETNARDNLGLVPNQNAAFKYSLTVNHDTEANLVTTAANSAFALVLTPQYDYYTVPARVRSDGRAQEVLPPFAGVIRQQWDETQAVTASVENKVTLTPGKVIRNLVFVARATNGGARVAAGITNIKLMYGDDTLLFDRSGQEIRSRAYKGFDVDAPTGVFPINFDDDGAGFPGSDYRRDYVDTRALSQIYALITTAAGVTAIDVVHDELIVPPGVSI